MYVESNPKSKKELKAAIASGKPVYVITVSPFETVPENGTVFLEGPHYPKPHKWYAKGEMKNGVLVKIT